jgi:hypothetical protein
MLKSDQLTKINNFFKANRNEKKPIPLKSKDC